MISIKLKSIFQFVKQVRQELSRITWSDKRSALLSTFMVFIFVTLSSIFLFLVDLSFAYIVNLITGLGG